MGLYRRKPLRVEAVQWTGKNSKEIEDFITNGHFAMNSYINKTTKKREYRLLVTTLEGNMLVSVGDYIIKGVDGEFYPCKPGIFFKTYEQIAD